MPLRKLTIDEIEPLANLPKVKKIAVENFLSTIHNNPNAYTAFANLTYDALMYGWNKETIRAIRKGINLSRNDP